MLEMSQSLEQIYQSIAKHIIQSIDDQWTSAWITVEVAEENVFSLNGYYCSPNSETNSFRIHPVIPHLFMEIRKKIKKECSNAWNHARFELQSDGNFNLHFDYEDRG